MVPTSYTVWMCRHKVVPQGGFTCCCTQCRSRQNPISIVYIHVAVGGLPTAVPGVWRSGDKTVHTQWIYRYIQCVFWAEHRLFNYFSLSLVKTVTYSCTGCMRKWGQAVHSGSCVLTVNDRTSIISQLSLTGLVVLEYPQLCCVTKILILVRVQVSWRGEVIFWILFWKLKAVSNRESKRLSCTHSSSQHLYV